MHDEYLMKYIEEDFQTNQRQILSRIQESHPNMTLDCECEDDTLFYYEGEELVAQLSVYIEANRVNLYDVEVMPELRGQGYGMAVLYHFLTEEFPFLHEIFPVEYKKRELVLQVSSENKPAYHLYLTLGFAVIEAVRW